MLWTSIANFRERRYDISIGSFDASFTVNVFPGFAVHDLEAPALNDSREESLKESLKKLREDLLGESCEESLEQFLNKFQNETLKKSGKNALRNRIRKLGRNF